MPVNQNYDRSKESTDNHILEMYKMCVESANQNSNNRMESNKFYITIHSTLIALFAFLPIEDKFKQIFLAILGLALCLSWYFSIKSYKRLNSEKFKCINTIELELPFTPYLTEWNSIKSQNNNASKWYHKYFRLSDLESIVVIIVACIYVLIFVGTIINLISGIGGISYENIQFVY